MSKLEKILKEKNLTIHDVNLASKEYKKLFFEETGLNEKEFKKTVESSFEQQKNLFNQFKSKKNGK